MKKNNIKKALSIIADIAIVGFLIVMVMTEIFGVEIENHRDLQSILVVTYLIFRVFYYKMDSKDKENKIAELEHQLRNKDS